MSSFSYAIVVFCVLAMLTQGSAGEIAKQRSIVYSADGGAHEEYPVKISAPKLNGEVGSRTWLSIGVANEGPLPITIPFSNDAGDAACLLTVVAAKVDDGEQSDYPSGPAVRSYLGEPFAIHIPPHGQMYMATWFVPWSSGVYHYRMTLRNDQSTCSVLSVEKTQEGLYIPKNTQASIPNVWVGEVTVSGSLEVYSPIPKEGFSPEDIANIRKLDDHSKEGYAPYLKALELMTVGAEGNVTLSDRITAVGELGRLKHEHATDALVQLLHRVKDEKMIRSIVVRALYDITLCGTGYRAIGTISQIAADKTYASVDRLLCIDLLRVFVKQDVLREGGRVLHKITKEERAIALETISRLREGSEQEPPEINSLLDSLK